MAKSLRSKAKRSFRSKKRETGVYAAAEAARLNRLNAKLRSLASKDNDGDVRVEEEGEDIPDAGNITTAPGLADEVMDLDVNASLPVEKAVSTHGPRRSRREEWRLSKGWGAKPKAKGLRSTTTRKAGRVKRRR